MGCRFVIADSTVAHTEPFSVPCLLPILCVCFHTAKPGLQRKRAIVQTKMSCIKGGRGQVMLPIPRPPVSAALPTNFTLPNDFHQQTTLSTNHFHFLKCKKKKSSFTKLWWSHYCYSNSSLKSDMNEQPTRRAPFPYQHCSNNGHMPFIRNPSRYHL